MSESFRKMRRININACDWLSEQRKKTRKNIRVESEYKTRNVLVSLFCVVNNLAYSACCDNDGQSACYILLGIICHLRHGSSELTYKSFRCNNWLWSWLGSFHYFVHRLKIKFECFSPSHSFRHCRTSSCTGKLRAAVGVSISAASSKLVELIVN